MGLSEFSIFHADIFRNRSSQVRGDLFNDVKYSDGFSIDMSSPKYAQYRLGLLLESILLYDKVFIELSDIPIIIYLWGSRYTDALTEIINNGTLRVINRKETIITSLKRGKHFELGIGFQPNLSLLNPKIIWMNLYIQYQKEKGFIIN